MTVCNGISIDFVLIISTAVTGRLDDVIGWDEHND